MQWNAATRKGFKDFFLGKLDDLVNVSLGTREFMERVRLTVRSFEARQAQADDVRRHLVQLVMREHDTQGVPEPTLVELTEEKK